MPRLLIATNNPGKLEEMRALLQDLPLALVTPQDLSIELTVPEDGQSYAENAGKKALAFASAAQMISLADDSGLEVDALHGAPGLYSHRYGSGPGATDADRRAELLQNLKDKLRPWTATFRATVAVAVPGNAIVQFASGECRGEIIPEERGRGGFGYDRIFFIPQVERTMAELSMAEKNRLSHRARAITNAKRILKDLFKL